MIQTKNFFEGKLKTRGSNIRIKKKKEKKSTRKKALLKRLQKSPA